MGEEMDQLEELGQPDLSVYQHDNPKPESPIKHIAVKPIAPPEVESDEPKAPDLPPVAGRKDYVEDEFVKRQEALSKSGEQRPWSEVAQMGSTVTGNATKTTGGRRV